MLRLTSILIFLFGSTCLGQSLYEKSSALNWADSVYTRLNDKERVSQLMIVRLSTIDSKSKQISFYDSLIFQQLKNYSIGGICIFQGNPQKQAALINKLQDSSKLPLLVTVDGEWGLGMRMPDSILSLPRQMMLGAIRDTHIVYQYGRVVADQCKRMGIQMDFAPVVDINNNPANPVINDRSFGENRENVAIKGAQYVRGLQDAGVMACIKHFPGHGDVSVDSHYDLPVISKSMEELDSMELYPFKKIIKDNVSAVMVGHLNIPAIDSGKFTATSLSGKSVNDLLGKKLGFEGLIFTDALEMQAVKKFFPAGRASVEALKAGNDMILLPENVESSVNAILLAIRKGEISWSQIEFHCKKILAYKYLYGLHAKKRIELDSLTEDLNQAISPMKRIIAEHAITLAKAENRAFFPLHPENEKINTELAYLIVGTKKEIPLAHKLKSSIDPDVYFINLKENSDSVIDSIRTKLMGYEKTIIGLHDFSRRPANNFGISAKVSALLQRLSTDSNKLVLHFGNSYAAGIFCAAKNLIICYEDDSIVQEVAYEMLIGKLPYQGSLPVSICKDLPSGTKVTPATSAILPEKALHEIDSVLYDAIDRHAMPGGVLLVARNGNVILHKAYGNNIFDYSRPTTTESIYDVASLTKIFATTLALMKLHDENRIDLHKKISHYLPETKKTKIGRLTLKQLLLHEGGLAPTIPFFKDYFDSAGSPIPNEIIYQEKTDEATVPIAKGIFIKKDIDKKILQTIIKNPVSKPGKYLYSDLDFILLGMIVERVSGSSLDDFTNAQFYKPLGLTSTGFNPCGKKPLALIVPSQYDTVFRKQMLHGYVHDPAAAIMGGKAGHAGLFGTAYDFFVLMQMLLQDGNYGGRKYLTPETIRNFTTYGSKVSRRGLGFDKPEKDNISRQDPYPAQQAPSSTFGHTGFTGTCAWADPDNGLVYIFLSNRVYPSGNDLLNKLKVRKKIYETIYRHIP